MIIKLKTLLLPILLAAAILACNVTVPTEIAIPSELPVMPTITFSENPPPEEDQPSQPVPVTGDGIDNQTLLFFGFLALLAVIVMLGLVAMTRKRDSSQEQSSDRRE
jgi:hypothetical protein